MSTHSVVTDSHSPVLGKAELERAVRYYRDTPLEALTRLKRLWLAHKGVSKDIASELVLMVNALSVLFDNPGGTTIDVHGDLWNASLATELILSALDMIRERGFAEQPLAWLKPVLMLNCTLANIWTVSMYRDRLVGWYNVPNSTVASYFQTIGLVWDVLWTKRNLLLREENSGVAELITMFAFHVASLHSDHYPRYRYETTKSSSSILGVALACWMHNVPNARLSEYSYRLRPLETVQLYIKCVEELLAVGLPHEGFNTLWRSNIDSLLEGIGSLAFMRTCCSELSSRDDTVGKLLLSTLNVLLHTVDFRRPDDMEGDVPTHFALASSSRRAYWAVPMTAAIAEAFEREFRTYIKPSGMEQAMNEPAWHCVLSCKLLDFALESLNHCGKNPPVIDGLSIYRIVARCLRFFCHTWQKTASLSFEEFGLAVQSFVKTCFNSATVGRKAQGKLQIITVRRVQEGLYAAAKKSWYIDLCALLSLRDKYGGEKLYDTVLLSWIRFGEAFGLDQTAERDQHVTQDKRLCSWAECKFHIQPSPALLSTCKGCGEQNYCSRECQKRDWKQGGHREKCRRLPKAS